MNRLFVFLSFVLFHLSSFSQTSDEIYHYVDEMISGYKSWSRVELSGKLLMDRLPLRPTVKVYMEKDVCVRISVRAPFIGEAGRLEISGNNILGVNKLKKVYVSEDISDIAGGLPLTVGNIQDILLARVFIVGSGTLSLQNFAQALVERYDSENWYIVPFNQPFPSGINYGFNAGDDCRLSLLYVTDGNSLSGSLSYTYEGEKTDILCQVSRDNKNLEAELSFGAPKWNPSKMDAFIPGSSYKRVGFSEFLRMF